MEQGKHTKFRKLFLCLFFVVIGIISLLLFYLRIPSLKVEQSFQTKTDNDCERKGTCAKSSINAKIDENCSALKSTVFRSKLELDAQRNQQSLRVTRLYKSCFYFYCKNTTLPIHYTLSHKRETMTIAIKQYDVNYCKVPKIGCTFMLNMFKVLTDAVKNVSSVLKRLNYNLHRVKLWNYLKSDDPSLYTTPTILMARNPFSRLFSAYVDKILLPSRVEDSLKIRSHFMDRESVCSATPTFKDFLSYVIELIKTTRYANYHWVPIYYLCKPCLTNVTIIIHQESFSKDVENLLYSLSVPISTRIHIVEAMTVTRGSVTADGKIRYAFMEAEKLNLLDNCLTRLKLLELLWKSFQIQGFIRPDRGFPSPAPFEDISMSAAIKLVKDEIEKNRLTPAEREAQRSTYLIEAYRDIPTDIVENIVSIFKEDFLLFGYDMTPPS